MSRNKGGKEIVLRMKKISVYTMYFYARSIKQELRRGDFFGWKPRGVVKLGTTGI